MSNKTGWPAPELMQDDHRGLFRWFASKADARRLVRDALVPHPTRPEVLIRQVPKVSYAFWAITAHILILALVLFGIWAAHYF